MLLLLFLLAFFCSGTEANCRDVVRECERIYAKCFTPYLIINDTDGICNCVWNYALCMEEYKCVEAELLNSDCIKYKCTFSCNWIDDTQNEESTSDSSDIFIMIAILGVIVIVVVGSIFICLSL